MLIPVAHPIVDSTGRVHTPQLTSWAYGSSKLVTVVAEAVAALSAGVVSDNRNMGEWVGGGEGWGSPFVSYSFYGVLIMPVFQVAHGMTQHTSCSRSSWGYANGTGADLLTSELCGILFDYALHVLFFSGVPGTVPYPAGYPGGPSYRPSGSAGNLNAAGE